MRFSVLTYADLHPAAFGQTREILVACIPHKLARHAFLNMVEGESALAHDALRFIVGVIAYAPNSLHVQILKRMSNDFS